MDLNYTPAELAFRDEVRAFVRDNLPPQISRKVIEHKRLAKDDYVTWQKALHAQGWIAPGWPVEFGGTGWNPVQRHIFEEECAAAGAPRVIAFGVDMVGPVIIAFGHPWQKERYLPRIRSSEDWWCQGYSEPGSGSDLASLKTRAERKGDHYIVNGQKTWTTLAQYADMMFCLVRTSSEGKKQDGISFLLIDMKTPGITVRPIITLDGEHEVNEVWLEDVKVPVENLVGEEGRGWTYAKFLLSHERTGIAGVSRSKRELAFLKHIASEQTVGGRPLIEKSRFRDKISRVEIDLMALEITVLRVLAADRQGRQPGPEASILKIKGTEIQQALTELMMEAVGPWALPFLPDSWGDHWLGERVGPEYAAPLAAQYLNFRKVSIYGGSNEIQRNIVSQMILGLSAMDFDYSEEQQLLKDSVGKFLEKNYGFETRKQIIASRAGYSPTAWEGLASLGLLGVPVPQDFEGFGGGGIETMIVMEAFGRHLVVEPYLGTVVMAASCIATAGTDEQKKYLLPSIMDGSMRFACAFTEAGGRYDLNHVETTARMQGGMWVIDGAKSVVMHGAVAELLIVSARTSGNVGDEHGISLFFVNPAEEGVSGREYPTYDGNRAAQIGFQNVQVSADSLIGAADHGLPLIELIADRAIAGLCAEAVGCMGALNDATLEYLKTRQQFGVPIGRFQALQHRMVDMLMHYEQAKSMALLAAVKVDSADAVERRRAVSAAKELIGRAGRYVSQQAIQLHGGMGMTDELIVSHFVKRLTAIDTLFGDSDHHLDRFAQAESAQPVELTVFERPRAKWKRI